MTVLNGVLVFHMITNNSLIPTSNELKVGSPWDEARFQKCMQVFMEKYSLDRC